MKKFIVLLVFTLSANVFAQNNAQKIYETEKAFAKASAEKGINQAFTEYLADEGIIFEPLPVNGREFWQNRSASPAYLIRNPALIDVSANGALGYSTGNSAYRPQGKDDPNTFYGEYATVWQRQPDGSYKAVLDIGIAHDKPSVIETEWKSPTSAADQTAPKTNSTAAAQSFFETAQNDGIAKAYKEFAADDIRLLRDKMMPVTGKKAALEYLKKDKSAIKYSKRMFFVGAGDLAYLSDIYTILNKENKSIEKGNIVQIWKLRGGVWQIVLDVAAQFPPEQK